MTSTASRSRPLRLLLPLMLLLAAAPAFCAAPESLFYPVPDAVTDGPFSVAVNGHPGPLEKAGAIAPAYYLRYQAQGTARVEVRLDPSCTEVALKPQRHYHNMTIQGDRVTFEMPAPGTVVLTARRGKKELPPLAVLRDAWGAGALRANGRALYPVENKPGKDGLHTRAIQAALDRCASTSAGGVVVLGPGTWRSGTVYIGSRTEFHLAPGALLQGSEDFTDYPRTRVGRVFVMFDHATSSSLTGAGVIDGMGHKVRMGRRRDNGDRPAVRLLVPYLSQNIRIENIVTRNPAMFNTHLMGCTSVLVRDLKMLNDYGVPNTDGLDPHGCRDMLVERIFGICGDDALAVKASHQSGVWMANHNIVLRDCVVMTLKTALKFGTGSAEDSANILWENIDVINSSRGIGVWMQDGGTIRDVVYRDIRMDLREFPDEVYSGEPVRLGILPREADSPVGKIENILFERVSSTIPFRSIFEGHAASPIRNVTFRDCHWTVLARQIKPLPSPAFDISRAEKVVFENNRVTWLTKQTGEWRGFLGQRDSQNIQTPGLKEEGP